MNQLIAYCGIDCEQCQVYIDTKNNKEHAVKCDGCRMNGRRTAYCENNCEIIPCIARTEYEHCGQCPKMEKCGKVAKIFSGKPEAKENLKA